MLDRINTDVPGKEKEVTTEDLRHVIQVLEDVSFKKVKQCTKFAFYNMIPELEKSEEKPVSLEDYYMNFLNNPKQKPLAWHLNQAMKKINCLKRKETILLYSARSVNQLEDSSVEQINILYLFNELGFFKITSDINVTYGTGKNLVYFLPVSDKQYPNYRKKYNVPYSFEERRKFVASVDNKMKRTTGSGESKTISVSSSFSVDKDILCDNFFFGELKMAIEGKGGINNITFMNAKWFDKHPTAFQVQQALPKHAATCYQIAVKKGANDPVLKTFTPIGLGKLSKRKHQNYLDSMGLNFSQYEEILQGNGIKGAQGMYEMLHLAITDSSLIVVSSAQELNLYEAFLYAIKESNPNVDLYESFIRMPVFITNDLFIGGYVLKVHSLARLCGFQEAVTELDSSGFTNMQYFVLQELLKYDDMDSFFLSHKEKIDSEIKSFFENQTLLY